MPAMTTAAATPRTPNAHDVPAPESEADLAGLLYRSLSGTPIVLLGGANVIMQLARLPVGRGVAESRVTSGRVDRHPVKRTRTTLAYLAIALYGTDEERAAYRSEVNRSHAEVRSGPDSDVAYNAFDRDLQLWVAACLYVGYEYSLRLTAPEVLEEHGEAFYRYCARLGTTLQVRDEDWPADRQAFAEYWAGGVAQIEVDDVTRRYLRSFANIEFVPAPMSWVAAPLHRFVVTGFLPRPFRDALDLPWGPRRAGAHARMTRVIMAVDRRLPGPIRRFPMNVYLADTRRRIREGRAIV